MNAMTGFLLEKKASAKKASMKAPETESFRAQFFYFPKFFEKGGENFFQKSSPRILFHLFFLIYSISASLSFGSSSSITRERSS